MGKFDKVISVYKQIKLNFKYLAKSALVLTSSAIAMFQIIGFLCDFNDIFPDNIGFLKRLFISALAVAFIWIVMFAIKCRCVLTKECVCVIDADNGHHVYVEYGDLFEDTGEHKNIVVTANRCFDTLVDNDLISETTIHGMQSKGYVLMDTPLKCSMMHYRMIY